MPVNKTALIRYKTIDQCLRNTSRNYTLDDLIEACSQAILLIEGNNKGASKRTVQADLQLMRDSKQGYEAPIVVHQKKYYSYAQAGFSILEKEISQQDLEMLQEANDFLYQLQAFKHFKPLKNTHQEIKNFINQKKGVPVQTTISFQPKQVSEVYQASAAINEDLTQKGFTLINSIYTANEVEQILHLLKQHLQFDSIKETGLPLLFNYMPALKSLLYNEKLKSNLSAAGLETAQLVNTTFYAKSPQTNFYTSPHQNITISVKEKHAVEGFTGWSAREGIVNVMPPLSILQNMISVRIYLEASNKQNGGLEVIPGSHKKIFRIQDRNFLVENTLPVSLDTQKGCCQILKSLILKAYETNPNNQNVPVIQLDFCTTNLPGPLSWHNM